MMSKFTPTEAVRLQSCLLQVTNVPATPEASKTEPMI